MMQVYCYDKNGFFTVSKIVEKVDINMTTETWEGLYKPKWDGDKWEEGATEEEIKEIEETSKVVKKPTENEILMSNIMLENATLKQQMEEQQELTSTLMLQIAELKGGNTNV